MDLRKSNDASEAVLEDEDYIDDTAFDSDRCGICTDVVIDRGVLDCCSHWFCFACIDNWAAITNLCPLCKNEFQLITCLPVYDTIGNIKFEEHSFPRDDDWCIQDNNNTLSFPSYYIDEDAVKCLDGDGCKIRSGLAAFGEDLTFDTSIACDSCDIWYHAFCVGFNPEYTIENSWLCPRCITIDVQQKSDKVSVQNLGKHSVSENANSGCTIDHSFSGKVLVSVADAGETAVVVSMVEGKQTIETSNSLSELKLDCNTQDTIETSTSDVVADNAKFDSQLNKSSCIEVTLNDSISNDVVEGEQTIETSKGLSELKLNCNTQDTMETSTSDVVADNAKFDSQLNKSSCIEVTLNDSISNDVVAITNVSHNKDTSKVFLNISPEMVGFQTYFDLEGNSSAIQSVTDSANEMPVNHPYENIIETSSPLVLSLATHDEPKANSTEETKCHPCDVDGYKVPCSLSFGNSANMCELSEDDSLISLPCDVPGISSFTVDKEVDGVTKNDMIRANNVCPSELSSLPEDKMVASACVEAIDVTNQEKFESARKHIKKSQSHAIDVDCVNKKTTKRDGDFLVKMEPDFPAKKAKLDRKSEISPSGGKLNTFVSEKSRSCFRTPASPKDISLTYSQQKQAKAADIMNIVQETNQKSSSNSAGTKHLGITIDKRDNAARLRVKKIIRRAGDEKESSILVQKLRREIRKVAGDKSPNNIDKESAFDAKLLTAFRAAIVKPKMEPVNKVGPSLIRAKKSLLQKGKVRENLTKKIYAASSGRRRRDWDRDREIEFWKHRCKRMKPEKVETLQSVLELLKRATSSCSEDSEIYQGPEGEAKSSILSRVYLADVSVFPRKDDIKPLSALAGCSLNDNLEKDKEFNNLSKKDSHSVRGNIMAKSSSGISTVSSLVSSSDSTGKRSCTSREASCRQVGLDGSRSGPSSLSGSISSKGREQDLKEPASQSNFAKTDKKKWALEVLARKSALMNLNASKEKEEDNPELKGKYPLLAQLPMDMRPVPAPSRHNKVPLSVRQAQLYRITEYYLRRAHLPVIRRTAKTELAVADAINVEKDIFERSNSKLVYVNLSSQFLSQLAKKQELPECDTLVTTLKCTDQASEEASSEPAATACSKVEEALKLAGLSDSPPNSPYRIVNDTNKQDPAQVDARGEALENVLDIDSHPELDIYGDFEYDIEDEGYTAPSTVAGALEASNVQPENGESKMRVVFSTIKHDPPKPHSPEVIEDDRGNCEVPSEPSTSLECKRGCTGDVAVEDKMGVPLSLEASHGEIYKEPSVEECEDLYGPEKEPMMNKISSDEVIGGLGNTEMEATVDKAENYRLKDETKLSEFEAEGCAKNNSISGTAHINHESHEVGNSPTLSLASQNIPKEIGAKITIDETSISSHSISRKVEAYIKEHIRPLCKSGVITVDQYRWAVGKTTNKVMRYHSKDKNANFLIKEGEKVKKLAEQYVEAAQQKKMD